MDGQAFGSGDSAPPLFGGIQDDLKPEIESGEYQDD